LIGINRSGDPVVTTVWCTELGATLLTGLSRTTEYSAYFRCLNLLSLRQLVALHQVPLCLVPSTGAELLSCTLPGCIGVGVQYYTSSLSFGQRYVDRLAVHVTFVRNWPNWIRVYDCEKPGKPALVSELAPLRDDGESREYLDLVERVRGQSTRIYVYQFEPDTQQLAGPTLKRLS